MEWWMVVLAVFVGVVTGMIGGILTEKREESRLRLEIEQEKEVKKVVFSNKTLYTNLLETKNDDSQCAYVCEHCQMTYNFGVAKALLCCTYCNRKVDKLIPYEELDADQYYKVFDTSTWKRGR